MKTLYAKAVEDNLITSKDIKDGLLLNSKEFLNNLVVKATQYNYDLSEANLLRCLKQDLDCEFCKIETEEGRDRAFEVLHEIKTSDAANSSQSSQETRQNFKSNNHGNDDIYINYTLKNILGRESYCGILDLKIYALSRHIP